VILLPTSPLARAEHPDGILAASWLRPDSIAAEGERAREPGQASLSSGGWVDILRTNLCELARAIPLPLAASPHKMVESPGCKCDICVFLSPSGGKLAATAEANERGGGGDKHFAQI